MTPDAPVVPEPAPDAPTVWLDYVDPASRLLDHRLSRLEEEGAVAAVRRAPYEILPPGPRLLDPTDPEWASYVERMREEAERLGIPLRPPTSVPWTRKAWELALLAGEAGRFAPVHAALFRAYWEEGRDLGRVDVLVEVAAAGGMERGATKAALDVDRLAGEVVEARREAERRGVRGVPTLLAGDRRLEGYPAPGELERLLSP